MDFMIDLFKKAKAEGVHTNIDTCGAVFTREEPFFSKLEELMKYTDMLMLDIKHIDDEQHKILTGHSNKNILEFARYLSDIKKPIWIRHVLVPERSDYDEYLERLHDFIETLDNVEKVEVLPYHTLGEYKWKELGYDYPLAGIDPPTKERVEKCKSYFRDSEISEKNKYGTVKVKMSGPKAPPTMIPTDCYALRAPTILPNIRISVVLTPHFYAHIGAGHKVILPLVCEHTWCQTFDPGIIKIKYSKKQLQSSRPFSQEKL